MNNSLRKEDTMTTKTASKFNAEPTILIRFRRRKVRVFYLEHEEYGYCWNFVARNAGEMIDSMTDAERRSVYSQIRRHAERQEPRR
jgi:Holliday junction resolvase